MIKAFYLKIEIEYEYFLNLLLKRKIYMKNFTQENENMKKSVKNY